jgi:ABC-type glutathione transport system ATPase component
MQKLTRKTLLFQKKSSSDKIYRLNSAMLVEIFNLLGYPMHWHQKMVLDLFTFVEKNGDPERPDYVSKDMMKQWFAKISKIFKTEIITKVSSYFYTLAKMKAERRGVIILLAGASGTGKSTLTSLLAGQLNIRPMSSDTIR